MLEGEEAFSLSQGDKAISHPQDTVRSKTLNGTLNTTNNSSNSNTIARGETKTPGHCQGTASTEGSNTFRQAIRDPKEAEAKSLFNLSRLHAEGEKVYGFYSEEIHS